MIRIITDSTSSLPKDLREKLGIHLLNLVVNRGGVGHVEGEMDLDAFYADIYIKPAFSVEHRGCA